MENKYIKHIKDYLVQKYGKIQEEWELSIALLEDNIDKYEKCKNDL